MASIHLIPDKFDLSNMSTSVCVDGTLKEWVLANEPSLVNEAFLCVAYSNGKRYFPLRDEWCELDLTDEDVRVFFLPAVGGAVSITIAVVTIIAAVVAVFLIKPPALADTNQPAAVFTIDGRNNQSRLNSPIEDPYGRNKLWVSYLGTPYVRFEGNNKQILYQHLCLGHGVYDIEKVMLEDSNADEFQNVEYTFDDIGVFPNNVSTARESVNLYLLGTNEEDYLEWYGGFAINPPNTTTNKIEIDWEMPQGCYQTDNDGKLESQVARVRFEIRSIDNDGNALGSWDLLWDLNLRFKTIETIRETKVLDVSDGRYEVRASRYNKKYSREGHTGANNITLVGIKAYMGDVPQPSGLTTISIKTRATANQVKNKINVLCTRKIPVWDGSNWSAPVANRNPIWAMVSILKAPWGAGLTDEQLNLEELKQVADLADANNETFDWVFEQKTTVWEACKACCFVCRSTPMLEGSQMSARRDVVKTVPTQLFNANNIIQGSFSQTRKMFELDGADGLEVEYLDHDTWKDETILCKLTSQLGVNPKSFQMRGVTNRTNAKRLGDYLWASEFYNRETVSFDTTHAGFLATYGDLITVESDVPQWGQGGVVELIEGQNTLTLSEPPNFIGGDHTITLRDKFGGIYGPFLVEPVLDEDYKVQLVSGFLDLTDIPISDDHENPHYIFGDVSNNGQICRVVKVQNSGIDRITITASLENNERFSNDAETAPPIEYPPLLPAPDIPTVSGLNVFKEDPNLTIEWDASANPTADTYTVSISQDGYSYTEQPPTALLTLSVVYEDWMDLGVFVKVFATNSNGSGDPTFLFTLPQYLSFLTDQDGNALVTGDDEPLIV